MSEKKPVDYTDECGMCTRCGEYTSVTASCCGAAVDFEGHRYTEDSFCPHGYLVDECPEPECTSPIPKDKAVQHQSFSCDVDMIVGDTSGLTRLEYHLGMSEAGVIKLSIPVQVLSFRIVAGFDRKVIHKEDFLIRKFTLEILTRDKPSNVALTLCPHMVQMKQEGEAHVIFMQD